MGCLPHGCRLAGVASVTLPGGRGPLPSLMIALLSSKSARSGAWRCMPSRPARRPMHTLEKVRSLPPLQMLPGPSTQGTLSCQSPKETWKSFQQQWPLRSLEKLSKAAWESCQAAWESCQAAWKSCQAAWKSCQQLGKLPAISYACMPAAWAAVW